jgi:hypothetical protein
MSDTRVFLSHCSHDVVLAKLIGHLLEGEGITCFYSERDIPVGTEFDRAIIDAIHSCNVLLVVWTERAAKSPWVNQEIGIALGKNIPVWPLAMDATDIQGPMFRRQGSLLGNDRDPHGNLIRLADEIKKAAEIWRTDRTIPFRPQVDQFVIGNEERTRRIVELLKTVSPPRSPYTLRMQAAFSCFAISGGPDYRVGGYHTDAYHALLVKEREEVGRVSEWATIRLIIWPQRPYEDAFVQVRFRNLLQFLQTNSEPERVRVVLGKYEGGNLYILDRDVLVMGMKGPGAPLPGYHVTTITYHGPTIGAAISAFDRQFEKLWTQHGQACHSEDASAIREDVIKRLYRMAPVGARSDVAS